MLARSLLLAVSLVLPGCLAEVDLSGTGYLCASAEECAPGLVCEGGRCAEAEAATMQRPDEVVRLTHPTAGSDLLTLDSEEIKEALDQGYVSEGVVFTASPTPSAALVPIYQLRHQTSLDVLLTASRSESDNAVRDYGYTLRGIAFYATPATSPDLTPVYRFQRLGIHRYAIGDGEREALLDAGWKYEHVLFKAEVR